MKREELHSQVTKFVPGVNSHGELLVPYRHDWYCTRCDKLTDFIGKILQDYNKDETDTFK